MPGWREIGEEINETAKTEGDKAYDITRRKYLRMVSQETGRHTILYATNWTAPGFPEPGLLMISDEDMQGMMEMLCKQVSNTEAGKGLAGMVCKNGRRLPWINSPLFEKLTKKMGCIWPDWTNPLFAAFSKDANTERF